MAITKDELRAALLARHPEWRGLIQLRKYSVVVRGVGSVTFMEPIVCIPNIAHQAIQDIEDVIERRGTI